MTPPAFTRRSSPSWSAAGLLVAASVLWGTTGTAASFMPSVVSPLAIGAVTMSVGGLLLFAVSARRSLAALRDRTVLPWLAAGAIGVFIYPLAFYSAMDLAGVAVGNVVSLGSAPVFAAILEWVLERRRPTPRWAACTAIAIAGIAILALFGRVDSGDRAAAVLPGVGLGLVAGLAYALYTYSSSRAMSSRTGEITGHTPRAVMGGMFGVGAVLLLPVLLVSGSPLLHSGRTVTIAGYLVLAPMFIAYLMFGVALQTVRSSTATTITLVEPLVATLLAVTVVGERIGVLGWIGLGMILLGVAALATVRQSG